MFGIFTSFFFLVILGLGVFYIKDNVNLSGKAAGTQANLVIDLGSTFAANDSPWANVAQGGEEKGRSLAPVVGSLSKLKLHYIRVDHIYDFFHIVNTGPDGKIFYNWADFDAYLGDITAIHAKPFLALSYMPNEFGVRENTDVPGNLGLWSNLVQATIEHVSGKAALGISDVYYEVWNEPDLFGGFKTYPPKNYLDLYRASVVGANNVKGALPFKIGGAATTGLYKSWFDALTKLSVNERLRLDFFSWHRYAEDIGVLEQDVKDVTAWNTGKLETFVTESGLDPANNTDYDGPASSIHTIAEAAVSAGINGLFSFEAKDGPGPQKFWGRWGLLTHEKWGEPAEKPRFGAFLFLNQMKGDKRFNIAGIGTFVKAFGRFDGAVYRLLVINFDSNNKHIEAVPMKFINLPTNKVTVKRIDFGGTVTNIPALVQSGNWATVQLLKPNSVSIFEITVS